MDTRDRFLDAACLTYTHDDGPARRAPAAEALAALPPDARADAAVCAVLGDAAGLAAALAADPEAATRRVPPRDWPPLLYLAYGRHPAPDADFAACVRVLLAAGADPDSHFWWGGQYRFTAVTGIFGEGEAGPANQPPHPGGLELARMLLEAGADPNDSQALYNRMFTTGSACLELLLASGLTADARNNWRVCGPDGTLAPSDDRVFDYQLRWACKRGYRTRVALLLDHGADPGGGLWRLAMVHGHPAVARLLEEHGAVPEALSPPDAWVAAVLSGDADREAALRTPEVVAAALTARPGLLVEAAKRGRAGVVSRLIDAGVPVDARPEASTALHEAAWAGHTEVVERLLAAGADPTVEDAWHGGTPAGWARHAGRAELAATLDAAAAAWPG